MLNRVSLFFDPILLCHLISKISSLINQSDRSIFGTVK